jgi:hypothetical protein
MEVTLEDRVLLWEAELSPLSEDGEQLRERTWKDTIHRVHQLRLYPPALPAAATVKL